MRERAPRSRQALAAVIALALAFAPTAQADRTKMKPGVNMFSPDEEIALGQKVAQDAEGKLPMWNDRRVDDYLNRLGKRLAAKATGHPYPYQFKGVNDKSINAFALPGGYMYVHRGVIEAADTEAQLAGVMAHEISHVALRHGTNQATKAMGAQVGLGVLGALLGGGAAGAAAGLVGGFAANSVLLKFSRDAERQADILGTQILYDNNYDPRAMAQFFEKIQAESKGGRPPEFFSSHPNPENRMEGVMNEIEKLGGPPRGYKSNSEEFKEIKRYVQSLPAAGKRGTGGTDGAAGRPEPPSDRFREFRGQGYRITHPENWRSSGQRSTAAFVPGGSVVQDAQGNQSLAYGVMVSVFEPHNDRYGQLTLEDATDQLIEELRHANPKMRVARRHERIKIGGARALSTYLSNESPIGGRETDWLITVMRPEGLLHFICVAPDKDYDAYEPTYQAMMDSVRFRTK